VTSNQPTNQPTKHQLDINPTTPTTTLTTTLTQLNNNNHHGLLSSLPRSPASATPTASLVRCQPPTISNHPSSNPPVVNPTPHNACRQLPSLPWPASHQAFASTSQMRVSQPRSLYPARKFNPAENESHAPPPPPVLDHGPHLVFLITTTTY
jgi:hypothetical protein